MGGVVSTQFDLLVQHGKLARCITFLEDGLRSLKRTPYHRVVGETILRFKFQVFLGKAIFDLQPAR